MVRRARFDKDEQLTFRYSWAESDMFELVMSLVLLLLTAVVGVFLFDAFTTKPSLERSHGIFWRSIVCFFFGIILSALWFLLSIGAEANSTEYVNFSIGTSAEALLGLIGGLRHWRKYQEYSRMTREIEVGQSRTVSAE